MVPRLCKFNVLLLLLFQSVELCIFWKELKQYFLVLLVLSDVLLCLEDVIFIFGPDHYFEERSGAGDGDVDEYVEHNHTNLYPAQLVRELDWIPRVQEVDH